MSPETAPQLLTQFVVWGALALGMALGAVGQATRFCVRGAIADWVVFKGPGRLVSWLVAIAVGAVAIQLMVSANVFDAGRTIYWSERFPWLSYLVGGLLFGYGMIMAGGCPQRCLVKAGSGNLKAAATLVVIAIASTMTLRGAFAGWRANGLDAVSVTLAGPQDLGAMIARTLSLPPGAMRWVVTLAVAAAIVAFAWRMRRQVERSHWIGGVAVGLLLAGAFFLTGRVGFLAEHPETLEPAWLGTQSRRPEGLSFSAPLGHALDLLTLWSDKATVATFGVMVALGTMVGAFVTAKLRGDFKLESFRTPAELGGHTGGAILMGFGGITALGCSLGNGVTGAAMLSTGALIATAGLTAGAWLALARQRRTGALPSGAVPATLR
ncbi:MAG TPA: YeeE/YedE family protein [Ramlibacter sp.]|nr:YeeE/YedE family protein [Ramlibacter sp.]